MHRSKKLLVVSTAIMLFSVLSVSLTLAYLIDSKEQQNQMQMGHVSVSVYEPEWDEFWYSDPHLIEMPATSAKMAYWVSKTPSVVNTGTEPCYVRVILAVGSDQVIPDGRSISDYIELTNLHPNWYVASGDPAFNTSNKMTLYYNRLLMPEEESDPIFMGAELRTGGTDSTAMANAFKDFNIIVLAQAVQAKTDETDFGGNAVLAFSALMPAT